MSGLVAASAMTFAFVLVVVLMAGESIAMFRLLAEKKEALLGFMCTMQDLKHRASS